MVKKKKSLTRNIELPEAGLVVKLTITPEGNVILYDKNENVVIPVSDERSITYARPKGAKFQSRFTTYDGYASISGIEELARLHSIFVIDTNTKEIQGIRVSVSFFIQIKIIKEGDSYSCVAFEDTAHAFEFHDVSGNPEMLAILFLSMANKDTYQIEKKEIGILTDSDLGNHIAFMKQELPIYDNNFLPNGFRLLYASADTGDEWTNSLIKQCDRYATKIWNEIASSPINSEKFIPCPVIPSISYRYRKIPILNKDIGAIDSITKPGGTYEITFHDQ